MTQATMSLYDETLKGIKGLTIQGAAKIAVAGVKAFAEKLAETTDRAKLVAYAQELGFARATEPGLRNALRYCLLNYDKDAHVIDTVLRYFEDSQKKLTEIGARKIADGATVFTHCHSSSVTGILKLAWQQGRKFKVHNTETRPRYQGRITATELAEAGIPVTHSVDSGGRLNLRGCDLFLFGADALTAEGNIVNKVGTTIFVEFAKKYDIPVYSCTNAWKFEANTLWGADEPIEQRDPKEVWENPPNGVTLINPSFELTPSEKIDGLITELGVLKPDAMILEIQKAYPWMHEDVGF